MTDGNYQSLTAKMAESDQNALKVHFGNDDEALQKQRNASNK
jgi:hypothetical protein